MNQVKLIDVVYKSNTGNVGMRVDPGLITGEHWEWGKNTPWLDTKPLQSTIHTLIHIYSSGSSKYSPTGMLNAMQTITQAHKT